MMMPRLAGALAGLALTCLVTTFVAVAPLAAADTKYPAAPTTATPIPSPGNPIEQNNAVSFIKPGEVPMPLDTVNTQRLAVPMEYLRDDGVRDTLGGITAYELPDGLYFKVARLFANVIGQPALMRELTRVGMRSRSLMDWVLRIMANLLRPDEIGPAEAAYRMAAAIVKRVPDPAI